MPASIASCAVMRFQTRAETELANVLADVRRGIWRPPDPQPAGAGAAPRADVPRVRLGLVRPPRARGTAATHAEVPALGADRASAGALRRAARRLDHRGGSVEQAPRGVCCPGRGVPGGPGSRTPR